MLWDFFFGNKVLHSIADKKRNEKEMSNNGQVLIFQYASCMIDRIVINRSNLYGSWWHIMKWRL